MSLASWWFNVIPGGIEGLSDIISYPLHQPNFNRLGGSASRFRTLQSTDKLLELTLDATSNRVSVGTPKSLQKLTDLTNYTVSAGKTAKLILILRSEGINGQFKIWEDTTVDSATGVLKYSYLGNELDDFDFVTVCPEWDITEKTFAAGKFITIEAINTNFSIEHAYVIES